RERGRAGPRTPQVAVDGKGQDQEQRREDVKEAVVVLTSDHREDGGEPGEIHPVHLAGEEPERLTNPDERKHEEETEREWGGEQHAPGVPVSIRDDREELISDDRHLRERARADDRRNRREGSDQDQRGDPRDGDQRDEERPSERRASDVRAPEE